MAVDNIWNAIADTAISTASSPPWSAGTAPANNEVILFPDGNTYSATGASLSAVTLTEMIVASGYSGNIGSSGTPVTISSALTRIYGSGDVYLTDGAGSTTFMIIDAASPSVQVTLAGDGFGTVVLLRGTLVNNGTITNLRIGTHGGSNADATATISSGGVATNIYQYSGNVTSSSTAVHGVWHMTGGTALRNVGNTITACTVGGDATMVYKSVTTLPAVEVGPRATLDFSQLTNALTVTELIEHPRATIRGLKSSGLVTFTKRWELGDATI